MSDKRVCEPDHAKNAKHRRLRPNPKQAMMTALNSPSKFQNQIHLIVSAARHVVRRRNRDL